MRKIDYNKRQRLPETPKTEFSREELLDILDFYLQYKPIFDKSSDEDIDYPPRRAAHDFTILLYEYGIADTNYQVNLEKIRQKYGKERIVDLSGEKLDFLEVITVFTFIHRADRHCGGGWYEDCIEDGTYHNLLCRLEEIRNEL